MALPVRNLSKKQRLGLLRQPQSIVASNAFQTTGSTDNHWTNPVSAGDDFRTMYVDAGTVIPDPNVKVEQRNLTSQNGALEEIERQHVTHLPGLKSMPFSGQLFKADAAPILAGSLHAVSEAAGTPFKKTYTSGFISGLVNFADNGGYLHGLAFDGGITGVTDGWIMDNCIVDTLTLTWDFMADGVAKNTQISGVWVGNDLDYGETLNGTWATTTPAPYNDDDTFSFSTITIGGTSYISSAIRRFEVTINNNTKPASQGTAGEPTQYDCRQEITATMVLDYNSSSNSILSKWLLGSNVAITMANDVTVDTDGYFSIDLPNGVIDGNPYTYEEDFVGLAVPMRFKSSSAATPITIVHVDTLDWGY